MARTRSRSFVMEGGTQTGVRANGVITGVTYGVPNVSSETCNDEASLPGIDHGFILSRTWASPCRINGQSDRNGKNHALYDNYRASGTYTRQTINALFHGRDPNPSDWASVVSRTNPSRPIVNPLMWAQNLHELPGMIKHIGDLLRRGSKQGLSAKDIADQHLAFQFGWAPLFSDLQTLFDVQKHMDRRLGELRRLYSNNGLKRRVTLEYREQVSEENFSAEYSTFHLRRETKMRLWGTVRWLPNSLPAVPPSDDALRRKALQTVYGLTPEAAVSGAWDLIPWSWLIDWFVPVGDYISQWSNTVPARHLTVNIMRSERTTNIVTPVAMAYNMTCEGGTGERIDLRRWVSPPTSTIGRLPFLNSNRMAVLGSLFVQRFMR